MHRMCEREKSLLLFFLTEVAQKLKSQCVGIMWGILDKYVALISKLSCEQPRHPTVSIMEKQFYSTHVKECNKCKGKKGLPVIVLY